MYYPGSITYKIVTELLQFDDFSRRVFLKYTMTPFLFHVTFISFMPTVI